MTTKPFPAPGQVWTFAGSDLAPSSGPHTIKNLRWFYGETEAVFEDGSVASIRWMKELDAWQHVDARPDDLAELARLTASELRKRGIWACVPGQSAIRVPGGVDVRHRHYYVYDAQFANLTPREIADVIQSEEAKRAAEWAGDK